MSEQFGTGCSPSKTDVRDYRLNSESAEKLPERFILPMGKVKNQWDKPTCVAHAIASLIEYHYMKDTQKYLPFSTEFIYGNRSADTTGEGMYIRDGLKIAQKLGDVPESIMPGNHAFKTAKHNVDVCKESFIELAQQNCITAYYKIRTLDEVKYAVYHHGAVITGIKLYGGYCLDRESVFYQKAEGKYTGHAVLIIGWTPEYLILQNSWGQFWGHRGQFLLSQDAFDAWLYDTYGVTDDEQAVLMPSEFTKRTAKIVNIAADIIGKVFMRDKN